MYPRVLISDDHRLLREGLRSLLQKNGCEVAAEVEDGRSAVKLARKLNPDVVILDICMPILNGIEATKQISREVPGAKVIVMSMHSDDHFVLGALHAGAAAYLLKDAAFEELLVAVDSVLRGQTYLSPAIARVVVEASVRQSSSKREFLRCQTSGREREVLQLLVAYQKLQRGYHRA